MPSCSLSKCQGSEENEQTIQKIFGTVIVFGAESDVTFYLTRSTIDRAIIREILDPVVKYEVFSTTEFVMSAVTFSSRSCSSVLAVNKESLPQMLKHVSHARNLYWLIRLKFEKNFLS